MNASLLSDHRNSGKLADIKTISDKNDLYIAFAVAGNGLQSLNQGESGEPWG